MEAAVAAPAFHPGVDTRLEAKQRKIEKRLELTVSGIQSLTEKMQTLPAEKQQEVLDFIEFLESKIALQNSNKEEREPISFVMAGQEFRACPDRSPADLATNKTYVVEWASHPF
ncbi:DUF2281 domain-containing protein [Scytonema sp. PRP1]|uniref:DUF2281 domain-containing protein n=1 Tax=Scytonema sp. PRP1 TaxID=3120513 RepID=UPI002FD0B90B